MERRWPRMEDTGLAEVVPGIWRLPVPLPGHSVGHVNVYALVSDGGVLLVDSGWAMPGSWAAVDDLLRRVGSAAEQVALVLVTHFHPDHCGLAGDFQRRRGVQVGMHAADACRLGDRFFAWDSLAKDTVGWLTSAGAPEDAIDSGVRIVEQAAGRVAPVEPDRLIEDGEVVAFGSWRLRALHTPGHTPGHLCFHEQTTRTLFSGDHVLSFINTSPGLRPHSTEDPVGDYLDSLPRLSALEVDWVLPGHQLPFVGLGPRLDQLRAHHEERMAETCRLLAAGPATAWEVTSRVPRSRGWDAFSNAARISALGETYGHLRHLVARGTAVGPAGPARTFELAR